MAIRGERRETLERWLFNYAEPPYHQSDAELAEEYRENLQDLHRAEPDAQWTVDELAASAEEIREVVDARMDWLERKAS